MLFFRALQKSIAFFTSRRSSPSSFSSAPIEELFPYVDPAIDGKDCDHDCATCEIHLPKGFKIDKDEQLYGHVNGWATHMLVATGKTDWVHDIRDEKGSVMEAVKHCNVEPNKLTGIQSLMLSASNMPLPSSDGSQPISDRPTTVLLLPSFTLIDNVTPAMVQELINHYISPLPTNTTPLKPTESTQSVIAAPNGHACNGHASNGHASGSPLPDCSPPLQQPAFTIRPCPHKYLILMCSHRTRDVRCGQSAPLLRREFERHLRPLGLYRDLHDERPGGVGIYFISHVGGHKFAANVMVYRRAGSDGESEEALGEASQCIWLARVRPEDCEGIVKFTVLQGKVVKPERQLRGGFDRAKGLVSW
ncbi:MAG: hypothetical protein Q9217_001212 [Psora testacea]